MHIAFVTILLYVLRGMSFFYIFICLVEILVEDIGKSMVKCIEEFADLNILNVDGIFCGEGEELFI